MTILFSIMLWSCRDAACFSRDAVFHAGRVSPLQQRQEKKNTELDEQLKEYIAEWRKQRSKEEEELNKLKEKQAKRKASQ